MVLFNNGTNAVGRPAPTIIWYLSVIYHLHNIIFESSSIDIYSDFLGVSFDFSGFDDYGMGCLVIRPRKLWEPYSFPIVRRYEIKESDKIYYLNKQGKYIWKEK